MAKQEIYYKRMGYLSVQAALLSGAPYEKEVVDGIISVSNEVELVRNLFKVSAKTEEHVSNKELLELQKKMTN